MPKRKVPGGSAVPARMSPDEKRLVRAMHFEQSMAPSAIAVATGRHLSSICRVLAAKGRPKPLGRRPVLQEKAIDKAERCLKQLIRKANGEKEVTMAMVKEALHTPASVRTLQRALHARDIRFRKLREKPRLTAEDVAARLAFATKYRSKSKEWWCSHLDMIIDLKNFPAYLNAQTRAHAAQREVRGAYRKKGDGLSEGYTTVNKTLRFNPGARSIMIAAGVGKGRVLMWEPIERQWSGAAAEDLYGTTMARILRRHYPNKPKYLILEDNDPTGFKSAKGVAAKAAAGIAVFSIPKRSPDLNVCDYALWKAGWGEKGVCMRPQESCRFKQLLAPTCLQEITRRMRAEESEWPRAKKESRDDYVQRLRRTALTLPKTFINKAVGDMKRRCQRLFDAKGSLFEEGGASPNP